MSVSRKLKGNELAVAVVVAYSRARKLLRRASKWIRKLALSKVQESSDLVLLAEYLRPDLRSGVIVYLALCSLRT
jgi:hypothetical protein